MCISSESNISFRFDLDVYIAKSVSYRDFNINWIHFVRNPLERYPIFYRPLFGGSNSIIPQRRH